LTHDHNGAERSLAAERQAKGKGGKDENANVGLLHKQCHKLAHQQEQEATEMNLINNWFIN
jgi:hypothetical protein